MNVIIVEDEPYATERLSLLLSEISLSINVVQKLDTIKSTVSFFRSEPPKIDLIFMDIELADGVCFEIFNQIKLEVPVVFTTAYDKYALKAFDINSIHYLLKPVNKEGLAKALDKYHTQNRVLPRDLMAIGELLASARNQFKTRFLGKHGNKLVHKETSSIAYFYSSERMVYIVDRERKKYLLDYTLEELAEQYLNPMVFYRVSRQFIVNINVVEVLKKYSQQRLQLFLKSGQEHEIVVSREKVSDFKNWLNK